MESKVKSYKAWFYFGRSLEDLGDELLHKGVVIGFEYDYENVYEWFEATINSSELKLNISRKHCFGEEYEDRGLKWQKAIEKKEVSLLIVYEGKEPSNDLVDQLALDIAGIIDSKVYIGEINYLNNDNYEYIERKAVYP